jgi:Cu+-exporting ATPase
MNEQQVTAATQCYHCGTTCAGYVVAAFDKTFCCDGCKMVYEILNQKGLCNYYNLGAHPGTTQRQQLRPDKFAFLEEEKLAARLVTYRDAELTHVTFYLPQIHCSSCLWLLENIHRINPHITRCHVNFTRKEVDITLLHNHTNLRKVAETLAGIGYEPYISLNDMQQKVPVYSRSRLYKLGIAGFCFANIMLMSFPEYLGINSREISLLYLFRYFNCFLSLPVVLYSATEFYTSAWAGLRKKYLNIDLPIVLAICITFARSLYEVFSDTGSGYFDSMTGIVFFMLVGRVLQDKTYRSLSFDRDYKAYFPLAVTKIATDQQEVAVALPDIRLNDTLLIHNEELVPADGILTRGTALIDYSFVTGESKPVRKEMGEIIYAGGRQVAGNIELLVIKEVAQSYLTRLWNRTDPTAEKTGRHSFTETLSRYFTLSVFTIALFAAVYWGIYDAHRIWNAVTAILIVACPCALLISNTFTNGNIMRHLARNRLYLRNAQTIENLAACQTILFDKTGTLTTGQYGDIRFEGSLTGKAERQQVYTLAAQSLHPVNKAIVRYLQCPGNSRISRFSEQPGLGISGVVDGNTIRIGSAFFVTASQADPDNETAVYVSINGKPAGRFTFTNEYRAHMPAMIRQLQQTHRLAVLSGDKPGERVRLQQLFGAGALLYFNHSPDDKRQVVEQLQHNGQRVMMIGDGLNDAVSLKQADVGMAICSDNSTFTPASDAILHGSSLHLLPAFIRLCRYNRYIVWTSFVVSILYNMIGLYYAVQGNLKPLTAAILMPASTLSIVLLTYSLSDLLARWLKLKN